MKITKTIVHDLELDLEAVVGVAQKAAIIVEDVIAGKPFPEGTNPKVIAIANIVKLIAAEFPTVEAAMASPEVQAVITVLEAL